MKTIIVLTMGILGEIGILTYTLYYNPNDTPTIITISILIVILVGLLLTTFFEWTQLKKDHE